MLARIRSVVVISDAPPAAPSFPSCRKRRGRKGTLGYVWCVLPLNSGKALVFRRRSTRYSPHERLGTRRLIRGVSNLIPVALERLPSIEDIVEIQMDVTFLRGSFLYLQAPNAFPQEGMGVVHPKAAPMRGSCRRKATDEVGAGDLQPRKNGAALRPSRWGEGNYFFPAFAFSRLIWRRFLTASSIGWISPAACRAILVSSGPTSS